MSDAEKLLHKYYLEDNFEIVDLNKNRKKKSNVCYVFFSSNGLYKDRYDVSIIENMHKINRYEWKFISSNKKIKRKAGKIIFLRDIYKNFYIYGISKSVNTINKIKELLIKETNGMKIILAGSSAGAYMSLLMGNLIPNTVRIISLGGVVNLEDFRTFSSYLSENLDKSTYPDITPFLYGKYWTINFYGKNNDYDAHNCFLLEKHANEDKLINIGFATDEHAPRPTGEDLIKLLICSDAHVRRLRDKVIKRKISTKNSFSIANIGIFSTFILKAKSVLIKLMRKHKK